MKSSAGFSSAPGRDFGILTSIDSSIADDGADFPHAVSGQLGSSTYVTAVGVTNLSTNSQSVTITFTPVTGNAVSVQRTLQGGGALREPISPTFQSFGKFSGRLDSSSRNGAIDRLCRLRGHGRRRSRVLCAQTAGATALLFDHIADLTPSAWTGIALLNPSSRHQRRSVRHDAAGTLIGGAGNVSTAKFVLPAKTKVAKLLGEMIPATQSRTSDGGFVFVRTTDGVDFGNEFFFLRSGAAFANVAAGRWRPAQLFTAVKLKPTEECRMFRKILLTRHRISAGILIGLMVSSLMAGAPQRAPEKFHLQEATIAGIQSAIRNGQITTTGLVELYLKRIKAYNGTCVNEPQGILGPVTTKAARGTDQRALHAESAACHAPDLGLRRTQGAKPDRRGGQQPEHAGCIGNRGCAGSRSSSRPAGSSGRCTASSWRSRISTTPSTCERRPAPMRSTRTIVRRTMRRS